MQLMALYAGANNLLAAGSPNAVNDIIDNPMFAGSLDSLSRVIQVCDSWFAFIVSFAAFFIISAAMLKNVIAGMYCSNKKLFDKVNEVKNNFVGDIEGKTQSLGKFRGVGTFGVFLLRMLPDPKELSEFQDDTIEPRDYFMKAIPQMVGVVMIGVVIYNGYYKDLLGKTATLGSTLIEKFIVDVDPVEGFNKLLGWSSKANLASEEDTSEAGQLIYKISKDMYHNVVTFYTDQSELNAKNSIASTIETWVNNQITSNATPYLDPTKWKASTKIIKVLNQPNLAVVQKTGDEQVIQSWAMQIAALNLDTKYHKGEDWWLQVIVVYDRVRDKSVTSLGVVTDGTLQVPPNKISIETKNNVTRTKIAMTTQELKYLNLSSAKINGSFSVTAGSDGLYVDSNIVNLLANGVSITGMTYTAGGNSAYIKTVKKGSASVYQITSSKGNVDLGSEFTLTTSGSEKK